MSELAETRPLNAQIWAREANEHYVEPFWCSERLFAEEPFDGAVYDPCCGFGRIVLSAQKAGLKAYGSDLVNRGWDNSQQDFLCHNSLHDNIVCNPPFNIAAEFALHALKWTKNKVAMIFPTARLNAAHWLHETPLSRGLADDAAAVDAARLHHHQRREARRRQDRLLLVDMVASSDRPRGSALAQA